MKTDLSKATPRPWNIFQGKNCPMIEAPSPNPNSRSKVFVASLHETATTISEPEHADADAALIVQAVNEYDALCEIAEAAQSVNLHLKMHERSQFPNTRCIDCVVAETLLRESLAKLAAMRAKS